MARTSDVTSGTVISSTWMNAHLDDYVSQTDTTDQDLASDLEIVSGKELRTNTISETTAASGYIRESFTYNIRNNAGTYEATTGYGQLAFGGSGDEGGADA